MGLWKDILKEELQFVEESIERNGKKTTTEKCQDKVDAYAHETQKKGQWGSALSNITMSYCHS